MEENVKPDVPRRRDYEKVLSALENRWKRRVAERANLMQHIVDGLWEAFQGRPYSWIGFYQPAPGGGNLVLGPHRDKPACSPIAVHGVCGRALSTGQTQIVADVLALGDAYVECDPANRSEIAVPVRGHDGKVFAVLDIDSTSLGAFNEMDQRWLERILRMLENTPAPHATN